MKKIKLQINPNIYYIDNDHSLMYSFDDEADTGNGWYIEKYFGKESKPSQLFKTKEQAMAALNNNDLKFSNQ